MKLYSYFRSSAAFRVRIALNIKGIEYETITKALTADEHRASDYLALNPQGLIPALESQGAILSQSLAIIEYLEERHPQPPLLPSEPLQRAQVRAMAQLIACDIHPLNNLRVLNYLKNELQRDDASIKTWYRHWIVEGFQALEHLVREHSSDKRFCFADTVTLADVLLAPQLFNARRYAIDLTPFPTLVAIGSHLDAVPAFAAAHPQRQADAH